MAPKAKRTIIIILVPTIVLALNVLPVTSSYDTLVSNEDDISGEGHASSGGIEYPRWSAGSAYFDGRIALVVKSFFHSLEYLDKAVTYLSKNSN
ncbi:hypothetical protein BDV96DRAFT_586730 [Lophiotrema nucula]|uniref:Uncharacterized protein n=1 Tax=Lophiotrema nucula TaxID=690887 RepID=A0A6A5YP98_9PLEO|nr:hypothetical protein BDV96DRAFT_586730 [Lophiotrema nucula]